MRFLLLFVLLAACSNPEPAPQTAPETTPEPAEDTVPPPVAPNPFADVDAQLIAFLNAPPLGSDPTESEQDARSRVFAGARDVNKAYKARLEGASRDDIAYIQFQRSRLFLAAACQMVRSTPPQGADPVAYRAKMIEASHIMFPGADEALRNSVAADGVRSPDAAQALLQLAAGTHPDDTCSRTEYLWDPTSKQFFD